MFWRIYLEVNRHKIFDKEHELAAPPVLAATKSWDPDCRAPGPESGDSRGEGIAGDPSLVSWGVIHLKTGHAATAMPVNVQG